MYIAIMIVHSFICVLMIAVILFQRSEGGSLASSGAGVISARGRADLLTRTTGILATGFFITSLLLTSLSGGYSQSKIILDPLEKSTMENIPQETISVEQTENTSPERPATPENSL